MTISRGALALAALQTLLTVVLLAAVLAQSYQGREQLVHSQRAGCARGKLDRSSSAAAWTAQRDYIGQVLKAQSVKADVKRAARTVRATIRVTAQDLAARSRIDCKRVFPQPSLLP